MNKSRILGPAFAALLAFAGPAQAASMPGMGELSGKVAADAALGQLSVYAFNTDKSVGYQVFVVNGAYRATNLFPGHYEISLRGTVGQLNWDLPQPSAKLEIKANDKATSDLAMKAQQLPPTYIGGMTYADAKVEPYDKIFPPGRGRDVMERVCFGCHTAQLYPYNKERTYPTGRPLHDKDGWAITVERMANGVAFNTPGKASNFDAALLKPGDQEALVDYLAQNFGEDAPLRAVQQTTQPALDPAALEKVEFVEYRFLNKPGEDPHWVHTPDFDGKGNVWIMDRPQGLAFVNPQTAEIVDHLGHGGGEYLTVDTDGTVWYGGFRHYDPKTKTHDEYKFEGGKNGRNIGVSTMAIDRNGDIWLSLLSAGAFAKYERKSDTVKWWDVPILRARPYGLTLDHEDKVWFAGYHNSAVARFDPKTQEFKNFFLTPETPTNIRRISFDSKNIGWASTWGSPGFNPTLFRLDPKTGDVRRFKIDIANANPYDAECDKNDNVWIATDNHLVKFDQKTEKFTTYPLPERSDVPKLAITREGAVWYGPRNGGQSGGLGGIAGVMYPDKDSIKSFAAYYDDGNARNRKAQYKGPGTPVTGKIKLVPAAPQNPGAYAKALGLKDTGTQAGAPAGIEGGASRE